MAKDRKAVAKRVERTYTDTEKASALALCDLHRGRTGDDDLGISEAARITKIPLSTLAEWHAGRYTSRDVPEIRREVKAGLVEMMTETVTRLIGGITNDKIKGARLVEITTAAGTLTDKALLLSGEATERSESKNLHLTRALPPPPP